MFRECPSCAFLARDSELGKVSARCPNCGVGGRYRLLFPDPSSIRLLEMIAHFYTRACGRQAEAQDELARALEERLGQSFGRDVAVRAARDMQELRRSTGGFSTPEDFERLL